MKCTASSRTRTPSTVLWVQCSVHRDLHWWAPGLAFYYGRYYHSHFYHHRQGYGCVCAPAQSFVLQAQSHLALAQRTAVRNRSPACMMLAEPSKSRQEEKAQENIYKAPFFRTGPQIWFQFCRDIVSKSKLRPKNLGKGSLVLFFGPLGRQPIATIMQKFQTEN